MVFMCIGGNVGSRIYRICNAASENVVDTTGRLDLRRLLRATGVSSAVRLTHNILPNNPIQPFRHRLLRRLYPDF